MTKTIQISPRQKLAPVDLIGLGLAPPEAKFYADSRVQ
jgi:hypothetical protein